VARHRRNAIYTFRFHDGSNLVRVTTVPVDNVPADYTPDGNKIALALFLAQNGTLDIYTMNADVTTSPGLPPRRSMTSSQTGGS
jgi:Tol biopolymer transport system component